MYGHLSSQELLPNEQKGCRKNSRGTKDQLLIGKAFLKNYRRRLTNLSMAWIDCQQAYDVVPHSWILECARLVGVALHIYRIDREQYGKLEDSVYIKPGGTWNSRHQKRNLSRRLIIVITVCNYYDATITKASTNIIFFIYINSLTTNILTNIT